jgi:hypothetical protein
MNILQDVNGTPRLPFQTSSKFFATTARAPICGVDRCVATTSIDDNLQRAKPIFGELDAISRSIVDMVRLWSTNGEGLTVRRRESSRWRL